MDFSEVKNLIDKSMVEYSIPCSDIAIMHNGEIVFRYWNGTSDDEKKIPLKGDELYFLYSATKPITCTAALQLYEKGKIALDDKLADYIPEFKDMWVKTPNGLKKAQNMITIKHLFTMTSGLNYKLLSKSIQEQIFRKPGSGTLEMVRAMAGEPLEFEPGEHFLYSLSHDVLAAVVELAADMSFGEYLKKNIFDVCGMERTGFALNDEIRSQICSQYCYDALEDNVSLMEKKNPFILTSRYQSGGAGLISCVDDYMRYETHMLNGSLLKRKTMDLMRKNHLTSQALTDFRAFKRGYCYGLGVRTAADSTCVNQGEFGWDGAAASYVLMDPEYHLGIFYATHVRRHSVLYEKLHPAIRDAVYKEIRRK